MNITPIMTNAGRIKAMPPGAGAGRLIGFSSWVRSEEVVVLEVLLDGVGEEDVPDTDNELVRADVEGEAEAEADADGDRDREAADADARDAE